MGTKARTLRRAAGWTMTRAELMLAVALMAGAGACRGEALVQIGSAEAAPGQSVTLALTAAPGVSVYGIDIALQAAVPPGAPPLSSPAYSLGSDTAEWLVYPQSDPWRFIIYSAHGVTGPAELATLALVVPADAPRDVTYAITARSVELTDDSGVSLRDTAFVAPGQVVVPNHPPVAASASLTTAEDTPAAVTLAATDLDGETLQYTVVTGPSHGTLTGTAPHLTYWPDADYHGPDSFTFTASDAISTSSVATVSISVAPVNDAPVITVPGPLSSTEGSLLAFTVSAADVDGDPVSLSAAGLPEGASFTPATGAFAWTPSFSQAGQYTLTFTASDGRGGQDSRSVVVNVANVNRPPAASADEVAVDEDTSVRITLGGSDPDGDALTYRVVSGPAHGTLAGTAPDLTYTPDPSFNGTDSFTYTVSDGHLSSAVTTVTLRVSPVNDPPQAFDQRVTVPANGCVEVRLHASDVEGDALSYSLVSSPSHGVLGPLVDGSAVYLPNSGYLGQDSFVFRVSDGVAESAAATVTLEVETGSPLLTLSCVTARPGGTATLTLSAAPEVGSISSLRLSLQPVSLAAAPPLASPVLSLPESAVGWSLDPSPGEPWSVSAQGPSPLVAPAEVARLSVSIDPSTPSGTVYVITPVAASLLDGLGRVVPTDGRVGIGRISVAARLRGDVSGDGEVTLGDALAILRLYVLGESAQDADALWAADVNQDGRASLADVILVLRHYVLGIPLE